jgi:hypothetical protein
MGWGRLRALGNKEAVMEAKRPLLPQTSWED